MPERPRSEPADAVSLTTSERLVLSIVRAARASRAPTPELREAVCDYVRELKGRGQPPERVLVAVKTVIGDVGLRRQRAWTLEHGPTYLEDDIIERVVEWCIEEYFRTGERAD